MVMFQPYVRLLANLIPVQFTINLISIDPVLLQLLDINQPCLADLENFQIYVLFGLVILKRHLLSHIHAVQSYALVAIISPQLLLQFVEPHCYYTVGRFVDSLFVYPYK